MPFKEGLQLLHARGTGVEDGLDLRSRLGTIVECNLVLSGETLLSFAHRISTHDEISILPLRLRL